MTKMSYFTTFKILINSVISTQGTRYDGWDIDNYYLETLMGWSEYMRIHVRWIPPDIIAHYNLYYLVDKYGWIYMEIIRITYGLPQADIISNKLLTQRLSNHGYYQVKQTPRLWWYVWISISLKLLVDDLGIGYVGQEHIDHLTSALKMFYEKSQQLGKRNYTVV